MRPRLAAVAAAAIVTILLSGTVHAVNLQLATPLSDPFERDLYNRACALFQPELLPHDSTYRLVPDHPVRGTPLVMEIAANWNRLSKPAREAFAQLYNRPTRSQTVISEDRHFKIHFDRAGTEAVDLTDGDSNGVPDYVDEVGRTFETVWQRQITTMGYSEPMSDGDAYFDVYVGQMLPTPVYGMTWPTDFGDQTSAAYMEVDNDYKDSIYQTSGLDGLHVTVAHEFHHAIQFAYFASDLIWWHELTATWMEEVVYPEVNDYVQYVDAVIGFPPASLDRWSGGSDEHPYGASIFAQYMAKSYGTTSLRRTWEALRDINRGAYAIEDIDAGLPAGGFAEVLPGYVVWNYFTGSRARSELYRESHLYPTASATVVSVPPNGSAAGSGLIDHLGAEYVEVSTSSLSRGLRASFTLESGGQWLLAAILDNGSQIEVVGNTEGEMAIPNVSSYQRVVFIPIVLALEGADYSYSFDISNQDVSGSGTGLDPLLMSAGSPAESDFDGNGVVDFTDFLAFAQVYGSNQGDGVYESRYDLNADGTIAFGDFLSFAQVYGQSVNQ